MTDIDFAKLIATLELRLTNIEKLTGDTDKAFKRVESRGLKAQKICNEALAKIGIGVSIVGIESFTENAIKSLAGIQRTAKTLGISTDSFQAFREEFRLAGGDIDTAEKALSKFEQAAAEAAKGGTNALSRLFKENKVSLRDQNGEMKKADVQLFDFAKLVNNAADQQTKLRLSAEVFGSKLAAQMIVPLEKLATQGLPAFIKAMKDAGLVIDGELLGKASKIEHEWTVMFDKLTLAAKGWAVETVSAVSDAFSRLNERANLDAEMQRIKPQIENINNLIDEAESYKDKKEVKRLISEGEKLIADAHAKAKGFTDAAAQAEMERETQRGKALSLRVDPNPNPKPTKTDDFFKNTSAQAASEQKAFEKRIDSLKKDTAAILAETAAQAQLNPLIDDYGFAMDKASIIAKLLADATEHNIPITDSLRKNIEKLAAAHAMAAADAKLQAESIDLIQRHAEDLRDIGKDALGGFISDLRAGKSGAEALANALDRVADRLIDMTLDNLFNKRGIFGGSSGGTGLFGGAIIPGILHSGGVAGSDGYGHGRSVSPSVFSGAGRYHGGGMPGLRSDEVPAILQRGEIVLPKNMGRPSGGVVVNYAPVINAPNATADFIPAISAALKENNRQLKEALPAMINNARKRGHI